ncbi:DNA repair protein XRCC2 [Aulostomus maculatus]
MKKPLDIQRPVPVSSQISRDQYRCRPRYPETSTGVVPDIQSGWDQLGAGSSYAYWGAAAGGEVVTTLFARLDPRRCLRDIEPRLFPNDGGPNHGEVVELYGLEGTGKTELLYHLLCRCVLPVTAGGLEVGAIFVDTDYSLDMLRLVSILECRLTAARSTSSPSVAPDEAALHVCLSRLLVVHCSSSSQLLLTLHYLEASLASRPGLALLIINSISAFYWVDRCEGGVSITKQEETLSKAAELLAQLLRDYRITVFASCQAVRRSSGGPSPSSSDPDRPYLCRSWQRLVTHRILCSGQETANNMATAPGGNKERQIRWVFSTHCTSSSASSRTKLHRSSCFCVTEAGVEFI